MASPPLEKVRQALSAFSISPGDKILVAVSGGPDSLCLLHLLKKLSPSFSISLHVAHLNHGLRPEAAEEARFVAQLSENWGLPHTLSEAPVLDFCRKKHLSKQVGARILRYRFFNKLAKQVNARWIATGHTVDDQAETFLMRMLRGSGMRGLSGIPEQRNGEREHRIIRPILHLTRQEILQELSSEEIAYVEDPSNQQLHYLRNRVRHCLIPSLENYNPKIKMALSREAALLGDEDHFLEQSTTEILPEILLETHRRALVYDTQKLVALHPALQRRLLLRGLNQLRHEEVSREEAKEIGFRHIEIILKMLQGRHGRCFDLPGGLRTRNQSGHFILERRIELDPAKRGGRSVQILSKIPALPFNKVMALPEWRIQLEISLSHEKENPLKNPEVVSTFIASFDFDKISLPLTIRRWQRGDRFAPLGMHGHHKKLQDYFVDAKIARDERMRVPILSAPEGILWIVGHRTDERFRVRKETDRILRIAVTQIPASGLES